MQNDSIIFHFCSKAAKLTESSTLGLHSTQVKPNGFGIARTTHISWILVYDDFGLEPASKIKTRFLMISPLCLALLTCPEELSISCLKLQHIVEISPGAQMPRCPGAQASLSKRASCA